MSKKVIGWTLDDMKGINPSFCMHRITLEEGVKAITQPQRRLNPTMREVVFKKVLKLNELDKNHLLSSKQYVDKFYTCNT